MKLHIKSRLYSLVKIEGRFELFFQDLSMANTESIKKYNY